MLALRWIAAARKCAAQMHCYKSMAGAFRTAERALNQAAMTSPLLFRQSAKPFSALYWWAARRVMKSVSTPDCAAFSVWMLTARRGQVVAFRTFLRTLVHELCHHLDFTTLGLAESLHTPGFFRRESSLYDALVATELTRREALSMTPGRSDKTQLSLDLAARAPAPRTPRYDGHGDDVARCGDRTRQRQRGAGEVLGEA